MRDGQGSPCELIDIGANLIKTKGDGAVEEQLQRCELTGVGGVIVTGTSVVDSRRALKLVRSTAAHAVKLYCTAGVHPHDAKSCDEETIGVLREMLKHHSWVSDFCELPRNVGCCVTSARNNARGGERNV